MRPLAIKFPSSDGLIVTLLRAGLSAYAAELWVSRKLPERPQQRMVTVRNDSGPEEGTQARRRYGINVWSNDSVEAEQICLDAMAFLRTAANGQPITMFDNFSGPYEVEDDPQMTVAGKDLFHFYFTFRCSVRASNA